MTSRSYFGKMNSILGSVVHLAMFVSLHVPATSDMQCETPTTTPEDPCATARLASFAERRVPVLLKKH